MKIKKVSKKKKTITIISFFTILSFFLFYPLTICEQIQEQNITKNVTIPISVCDIGSDGIIKCGPSTYQKEVTETIRTTTNVSCNIIKDVGNEK